MLTDRKTLGFRDVLIRPEWSPIKSRKDVSLERTFKFSRGLELTCVPIIASNMKGIGTLQAAKVLSNYHILTCLHDKVSWFDFDRPLGPELSRWVIPTVKLDDFNYMDQLAVSGLFRMICLDVANGYMEDFIEFTTRVHERYNQFVIMAGNVATAAGAQSLFLAGADIVKVGLGSGSVCTTRFKTGVGVPQITAIDECQFARVSKQYTCSDGGCTNPGDVAKAFVAGADFVMLGGMFAGTKETGGSFRGSAHDCNGDYKTSEGKEVRFPGDRRSLEEVVQEILGGLRSTGSYIGQDKIENFYKAELIQVTEQTNDWLGKPE